MYKISIVFYIQYSLDYELDGPDSITGVGGGEDSSFLRVKTGPGVHSASYKTVSCMSGSPRDVSEDPVT